MLCHFVAGNYSVFFLFILFSLNKYGYELKIKIKILCENLPQHLGELSGFIASNYHQEFAFARAVPHAWKEKVTNFSHCSPHTAWYERGTSSFTAYLTFSHMKNG